MRHDAATGEGGTFQRVSLASRYVLAFGAITLLTVGGMLRSEQRLEQQRDNTRIINISGRQRTLSQRVVKSLLLETSTTDSVLRSAARQELARSLAEWRDGRSQLLIGDPERDYAAVTDAALRRRLEALDPAMTAMRAAVQARDLPALLALESAYVAEMDAITSALADLFEQQHEQLIERERVRVVFLLLVLLGLGVFIFDPAARAITRNAKRLQQQNAELDAALVEARSAARIKDEFLATTSHELRTPLNAVIGLSSLLRTTGLDPRQRQFVDTINTSGENLLQLINDLLDLSKMDAGKLELEAMDFELRDVIETNIEALALRAESKAVDLGVVVEPGTPEVIRGDAGRLGQVLLNLLSNALKFTEAGSVMVRVMPVAGATPHTVRIEVEDTGIGISAEAQARLFQPFHQADSSTTRKYGGTGLGLSISRRLVELMGGDIGVRSAPGEGSTFWVEVPFRAAQSTVQTDQLDPSAFTGTRVLVVDDLAANRLVLSSLLTSWGMRTIEATSAEEAQQRLAEQVAEGTPIPLAILDWQMPDADGYELAQRIRNDPDLAGIKLILLSSYSRGPDEAGTEEAGFDYALAKPVRQRTLFRAIHSVIGAAADLGPGRDPKALPRFENARVLVVDDNPVNTLVLRAMLEPMGINADTAANGIEAVEAMERSNGWYDLVLMDVQMPEMDGREATRQIRARFQESPNVVPIVAVTAAAMSEDRALCLDAGMTDYVTKPIPLETLVATLKKWIPR